MDALISSNSTISVEKAKFSTESCTDGRLIIYIWDMDETLILLKSLLTGAYAEAFNGLKDVQNGIELGKGWEKQILQVCDEKFFYEQIENYNEPSLDSLNQYDDGRDLSEYDFNQDGFSPLYDDLNKRKLAYRHRVIAQRYEQSLQDILDQETTKHLDDLYELTDNYTERWLSSARTFLEECSGGIGVSNTSGDASTDAITGSVDTKVVHVLVTSGSLIPSLVKCLLFRLDHLIPHGNVYSSWEVGKLHCFTRIQERFNTPNTQFCVIGDGWEECEAAQAMKWPFVKIEPQPGGYHKFPGLTVRTLGYYLSVVYENSNPENDDG